MGVDVDEFVAAFLVFEDGPGGGAGACRVPAFGRLFRGLGEPECAPLEEGDSLLVVQNG